MHCYILSLPIEPETFTLRLEQNSLQDMHIYVHTYIGITTLIFNILLASAMLHKFNKLFLQPNVHLHAIEITMYSYLVFKPDARLVS